MMKTPLLLMMITLASLIFLSGCVSLVQEIEIEEDGSGMMRFALGVDLEVYDQFHSEIPEGFELENLLSIIMRDENVSNVQIEQYVIHGRMWDSVQLTVVDFSALFQQPRRIGPLTMSLSEDEGVYTFSQSVNVAGSTLRIPGVNLLDLSGSAYTVRLVTPQIIRTNGIQSASGVSTWNVSLPDLLQNGGSFTQRAEYVLVPYEGFFIPYDVIFPYVVIGFLALNGVIILLVIIFNTTKKREKELKLHY